MPFDHRSTSYGSTDSLYDRIDRSLQARAFGEKEQTQVFKRLARYLARRQPLSTSIDRLYDIYSKKGTKPGKTEAKVLKIWQDDLREGDPFHVTVSAFVKPTYRGLITSGSVSGELATALNQTVHLMRLTGEIRKKIRNALIYPMFIITYVMGLVTFMGGMLLPMFKELAAGQEMPMGPQVIDVFSTFMMAEWKTVAIGIAILIAVILYGLPRYTGPGRTIIDDLPIFRLYRIMNGIVFLYALGSMTRAKFNLNEALSTMMENASPWLASRIQPVIYNLQDGAHLGSAFDLTGHNFPDEAVIGDLYVFEATGGLDVGLLEVAQDWVDDTMEYAEALSKSLNRYGLIIAALSIMGFYLSIYQLYALVGA